MNVRKSIRETDNLLVSLSAMQLSTLQKEECILVVRNTCLDHSPIVWSGLSSSQRASFRQEVILKVRLGSLLRLGHLARGQ